MWHIINKYFKGIGEIMSIKELIEAAKNTQVTSEQVNNLRIRLQQQGNEQVSKSSSTSKQFLARTYSL